MTAPLPSYEAQAFGRPAGGWRRRWFNVIFEADTPAGRHDQGARRDRGADRDARGSGPADAAHGGDQGRAGAADVLMDRAAHHEATDG